MPDLVILFRGEPIGKGRPRARIAESNTGKQFVSVYTPAKTRAYEDALKFAASAAMAKTRIRSPLDGPLEVRALAVMPIPASWSKTRRDVAIAGTVRPTTAPDVDNIAKCFDALNKIVWLDDKQVVDLQVSKWYGESPYLQIEVSRAQVGLFKSRISP